MNFDQDLEHLSYVDESKNSRYNSRAVFSDVGIGVEVEEYEGFTLYEWRGDKDFESVLEAVERFFPLQKPALGLVKEEGRLRDVKTDFESKKKVYEDREDWQEGRWDEYSLIQMNLENSKVVYDEKEGCPRLRVYEIGQTDVFEKIFPQTVSESSENILEDIIETQN
ncbi:hypothetical protein [Candidatus Nanohalobium constans]|uniref:Uncharacterized protein n=1 Tax=Candidatus Nanohalobium constans TaxID=2565781 RepID=A0A5Q0UG69_9ARCH|nr:hypothetical protein [Candidatus Nanohalobium constans]QGA80391.1 hypothetical protein LC1Nh_0491 [Candidatus Nanohalobium constans]